MPKDSSAKYRQYEKSKGHVQGIPVNAQGFLVSCHRGKERHATVELLSVLNEFVPEDAVVDQNASIDDQIQAEIAELNKSKAFAVKSLGDCLFFVKSSLEPTAILDQIFSELSSSKQKLTRYVSRIVPLQATCHANVDDIVKITRALIAPWFSLSAVKYSIVQKSRNNSGMSRDILIETVAAVVREFQPEHVVDLANPEVCIIVQVFKGTAGISVVKNYHERSKFNIEQVAAK